MIRSLFCFSALFAFINLAHARINRSRGRGLIRGIQNTRLGRRGLPRVEALQQRVIDNGGCNPNLCFALDGSGSISVEDYELQKEFVEIVAAIVAVDEDAAFGAVQYGLRNIPISRLTTNANQFLRNVERSRLASASRTFIAAGLGHCIRALRRVPGNANKIVLLGDGRSNFGGNPVPIAQRFLPPRGNGAICSVGVGFQDTDMLLNIVGGDPRNVLQIDEYFELLDILDILVAQVCGLPFVSTAPVARNVIGDSVMSSVKSFFKM